MAAFALTSQIAELDNFNLDSSFEDFVKETQLKLLSMPDAQADEQAAPITCDLSSFKALNFDAPQTETTSNVDPLKLNLFLSLKSQLKPHSLLKWLLKLLKAWGLLFLVMHSCHLSKRKTCFLKVLLKKMQLLL